MLRALRHRDFRLLWTGQAISLAGDGIYLVAIAWLVYDISNQPGALAIVGFAWTLPQVAGLLLAGVLSDRFERRRLLILADLIRFLAIGTIAALTYADVTELWHLIVLVVFYGLGQALFQPAFTAIVPEIVPREELLQANAMRELLEPLGMRFFGPALGGVLIAVFGVGTAFLIDALTFLASALAVIGIERRPPLRAATGSMWRDLGEGFAYVRAHAWLWGTLVGAALFLLFTFGPFEVLLPYIIRNELGGDAATFGTVLAAGGAGSFFGRRRDRPGRDAATARDVHVGRLVRGRRDVHRAGLRRHRLGDVPGLVLQLRARHGGSGRVEHADEHARPG